ncbi:MAG TPA: hypothetical protein VF701_18105 [Thermoanaerobaculia bacterium]
MVQIAALLHGKNIWQLDEHGQRELGGVFTWRSGSGDEADQVVEAVRLAFMRELQANEDVWNGESQPFTVEVDETREIPEDADPVNTGLVFYIETDGEGAVG